MISPELQEKRRLSIALSDAKLCLSNHGYGTRQISLEVNKKKSTRGYPKSFSTIESSYAFLRVPTNDAENEFSFVDLRTSAPRLWSTTSFIIWWESKRVTSDLPVWSVWGEEEQNSHAEKFLAKALCDWASAPPKTKHLHSDRVGEIIGHLSCGCGSSNPGIKNCTIPVRVADLGSIVLQPYEGMLRRLNFSIAKIKHTCKRTSANSCETDECVKVTMHGGTSWIWSKEDVSQYAPTGGGGYDERVRRFIEAMRHSRLKDPFFNATKNAWVARFKKPGLPQLTLSEKGGLIRDGKHRIVGLGPGDRGKELTWTQARTHCNYVVREFLRKLYEAQETGNERAIDRYAKACETWRGLEVVCALAGGTTAPNFEQETANGALGRSLVLYHDWLNEDNEDDALYQLDDEGDAMESLTGLEKMEAAISELKPSAIPAIALNEDVKVA